MALERAKVSAATRRFIIGRSGGCCNKCRIQIFIENEFGERARIGDDSHIYAYSPAGPRGIDAKGSNYNNDYNNLILLCKNCHSEVDQQVKKYDSRELIRIRDRHYDWVERCLSGVLFDKPKFHYTLYLNLIRIDMYAVSNSIPLPAVDVGQSKNFHDLGMGAGRVVAAYTALLNSEQLQGLPLEADFNFEEVEIGQYLFIPPQQSRTRAVGRDIDLQRAWEEERGIVYFDIEGWRLICRIDPKWITTRTGEGVLRSGRARLCGLVRVSDISSKSRKIVCSPLFLAQS